jgi:hypothetical protein
VIRHLDQLLRDLLVSSIDEIADETQVSFRPPDDDWIAQVATLTVDRSPVNALNVYLIERRENLEEVAFVAYHFHWPHEEVMALEHADRRRWVAEISSINRRMNAGE